MTRLPRSIAITREEAKAAVYKCRLRTAKRIDDYKASHPCSDCGLSFPPECMDFDHRDGVSKTTEVSRMRVATAPWSRIQEEMAKCDLVCACCHRIRTKKRMTNRQEELLTRRRDQNLRLFDAISA